MDLTHKQFLSTPSGWRATSQNRWKNPPARRAISIHALRVEGDGDPCHEKAPRGSNFYPRPPGGGRRDSRNETPVYYFISIHALRVEGDRERGGNSAPTDIISIHALRVEGDKGFVCCLLQIILNFYPRPPGGGRHIGHFLSKLIIYISIHALRVEGDMSAMASSFIGFYFYPRPPGGGRLLEIASS